jgi:glycosyltransferase involved in cell wall biosynthesis
MKISIYSTMVFDSHPYFNHYAGLELVVGLQAKYLDEIGHEVNLFATKESFFNDDDKNKKLCSEKSKLIAVGGAGTDPVQSWKAFWDDPRSRQILKDSDIVIDHSWSYFCYSVFNELKHVMKVYHGPDPGFINKPPFEKPNLIGVSFNHAQYLMKQAPGTIWRAVQNGIPLWRYNINKEAKRDRLLWVSRLYYPKGCHRAIKIADKLQMPIDLVGGSFGQVPAYEQLIKEMCAKSKYANYVGPVDFQKKLEYYQNAKCVIMPIIESLSNDETTRYMGHPGPWEWHEPLGLVTPEANACGTPVIVTPNGGWNETMMHGYNGFFANSDEEFEYFVKRIDEIKPDNCRAMAEKFDYKIMGANYMKLIDEVVNKGGGW